MQVLRVAAALSMPRGGSDSRVLPKEDPRVADRGMYLLLE